MMTAIQKRMRDLGFYKAVARHLNAVEKIPAKVGSYASGSLLISIRRGSSWVVHFYRSFPGWAGVAGDEHFHLKCGTRNPSPATVAHKIAKAVLNVDWTGSRECVLNQLSTYNINPLAMYADLSPARRLLLLRLTAIGRAFSIREFNNTHNMDLMTVADCRKYVSGAERLVREYRDKTGIRNRFERRFDYRQHEIPS